jgi:hypothetical protein
VPAADEEMDDIARCLEDGTGHLAGLRALREAGRISHVSLGMNSSGARNAFLDSHFYTSPKHDLFAQTGSGQT